MKSEDIVVDKAVVDHVPYDARIATTGGILAAVGTMVCCTIPLVLVLLGVTSVWIGWLTSFYVYQPYFIAVTLGFVAYGFYTVYWRPKRNCTPGTACIQVKYSRSVKAFLWTALALMIFGVSVPYFVLWMYYM